MIKEGLSKKLTSLKNIQSPRKNKNDLFDLNEEQEMKSGLTDNENSEEENSNNDNIENSQKIRNLIEDNASQSSAMTKTSLSSFWNVNKSQAKDNQNNFANKKFIKLQMLLGVFLLILLILIIILFLKMKNKQNEISEDCNNYLDLIQFIRIFHQFSVQFLTVVCVIVSLSPDGICKSYISQFDDDNFNQTLFNLEQNVVLAELGSERINQIIIKSESIRDDILRSLLKGNFSYIFISKKKVNNIYHISNSKINISLNDAFLLTSNNMRIIVSSESKFKYRDKEPIYLLSGFENRFENIKNLINRRFIRLPNCSLYLSY